MLICRAFTLLTSPAGLDSRTRSMLEEARGLLQTYKAIEAAEREKLETRLAAHTDQQNMIRDQRLVRPLPARIPTLSTHFMSGPEYVNVMRHTCIEIRCLCMALCVCGIVRSDSSERRTTT